MWDYDAEVNVMLCGRMKYQPNSQTNWTWHTKHVGKSSYSQVLKSYCIS